MKRSEINQVIENANESFADTSDNRFHEVIGRFPSIEEDMEPLHLLVSDYLKFI